MQSGGLRTSQGGLGLTMQEVMQLLNATEIEELEEEEPEEEEDDEDEDYTSRRYHSEPDWYPTATKEPKAEGLELLKGGDFGRTGVKLQARSKRYNSVQSVLARSSTPVPLFHKEDIHAVCLSDPTSFGITLIFRFICRLWYPILMEPLLPNTMPTCTLRSFQTVGVIVNQ